jgi:hypothetical protein
VPERVGKAGALVGIDGTVGIVGCPQHRENTCRVIRCAK